MLDFLWTRPETSPVATILLAHGSGAPMDCPFMEKLAVALAYQSFAVARFEFSYMACRRQGTALPPRPLDIELIGEYRTVLRVFMGACEGPVLIGGKSMGARVAAKLAAGGFLPDRVAGLCCFGYPFHQANEPDSKWHVGPLRKSGRPILICQGENDPMGRRAELEALSLPEQVTLVYLEGGTHDFSPAKDTSASLDENIGNAARATTAFVAGFLPAQAMNFAQSENQSQKRGRSLLTRLLHRTDRRCGAH
ncbi:alpha/beta family hydrolase [uncultured Roseibium sp.]|uniref:alpha/beta family hydrolase n=1 Tax=uncultured Roseibium sp. TaxID=1936171 RepID=UPI0032175557